MFPHSKRDHLIVMGFHQQQCSHMRKHMMYTYNHYHRGNQLDDKASLLSPSNGTFVLNNKVLTWQKHTPMVFNYFLASNSKVINKGPLECHIW